MARMQSLNILAEVSRLRQTAAWSFAGLRTTWTEEKSFRQWLAANALSWLALCALHLPPLEVALLFALGAFVLVAELFNTAIETTIDYVSTSTHPLAKKAKDVASAAVFLAAVTWAVCWALIVLLK